MLYNCNTTCGSCDACEVVQEVSLRGYGVNCGIKHGHCFILHEMEKIIFIIKFLVINASTVFCFKLVYLFVFTGLGLQCVSSKKL